MKIYQISGLGANQNAFKYLKLNPEFELAYIPWLLPERKETLQHYAERMAEYIDPNEKFMLMGLSFGGIILSELNQLVKPEFNFLISTVKSRSELPLFMRFCSKSRIHRGVPAQFFASDKGLSYAFFRKLYSSKMPDLNEFFEYKDPYYIKWSIDQIVNWETPKPIENYLHLHGNKDIVFPVNYIQNAQIVEGGTHLMVMQKQRKVTELINQKLAQF